MTMERRRLTRRTIAPDEPLGIARLRTGGHLQIVNASGCGVLAETRERLLPGRHIDVHLVASGGRVLVRAHVSRAYVCWLMENAIAYRVALAFDRLVEIHPTGEVVPVTASIAVEGKALFVAI